MESAVDVAARILDRHPGPGLPLRALRRRVARELIRGAPSTKQLLRLLRRHPERFRILTPWRGPWRFLRSEVGGRVRSRDAGALRDLGLNPGPWVVPLEPPREKGPWDEPPSSRNLRATLRFLGTELDSGSGPALLRWIRMVREFENSVEELRRLQQLLSHPSSGRKGHAALR